MLAATHVDWGTPDDHGPCMVCGCTGRHVAAVSFLADAGIGRLVVCPPHLRSTIRELNFALSATVIEATA